MRAPAYESEDEPANLPILAVLVEVGLRSLRRRGRCFILAIMKKDDLLGRITASPQIFGGKPIIRGMRISVELILSLLSQGETWEAILDDYPDLTSEDIRACLAYAHAVIANDSLDLVKVTGK